jgi:hypothetical protein
MLFQRPGSRILWLMIKYKMKCLYVTFSFLFVFFSCGYRTTTTGYVPREAVAVCEIRLNRILPLLFFKEAVDEILAERELSLDTLLDERFKENYGFSPLDIRMATLFLLKYEQKDVLPVGVILEFSELNQKLLISSLDSVFGLEKISYYHHSYYYDSYLDVAFAVYGECLLFSSGKRSLEKIFLVIEGGDNVYSNDRIDAALRDYGGKDFFGIITGEFFSSYETGLQVDSAAGEISFSEYGLLKSRINFTDPEEAQGFTQTVIDFFTDSLAEEESGIFFYPVIKYNTILETAETEDNTVTLELSFTRELLKEIVYAVLDDLN